MKELLIAMALLCAIFLAGFFLGRGKRTQPTETEVVAVVVKTDTIMVERWRTDTLYIRREVASLPIVRADTLREVEYVEVEVPITQVHYADTLAEAWVSGYRPSLDSLRVYPRTVYVTERMQASKPSRWSLGVSAGAAVTGKGISPYIGVGLTYTITRF